MRNFPAEMLKRIGNVTSQSFQTLHKIVLRVDFFIRNVNKYIQWQTLPAYIFQVFIFSQILASLTEVLSSRVLKKIGACRYAN